LVLEIFISETFSDYPGKLGLDVVERQVDGSDLLNPHQLHDFSFVLVTDSVLFQRNGSNAREFVDSCQQILETSSRKSEMFEATQVNVLYHVVRFKLNLSLLLIIPPPSLLFYFFVFW